MFFKKKIVSLFLFGALFFVFGCGESNFNKAVSYQKDGEYQKAIEYYELAIQNKEKTAESEKYLGDIFFGDKKYDEALKHYRNSLEIDPTIAIDTIMKYISFNDVKVRDQVGNMLASIDSNNGKKYINLKLSKILNSQDQYKILDALDVINKMGDKAEPISDDIFNLLDSSSIVKQKVLDVLPSISKIVSEKYGFDKLLSFLEQKDEILKAKTIDCLGDMREYAITTLPALIELDVKENRYSRNIFAAIEKMGPPTKEQMNNMYSFLKDKPKEIKIRMLNIWGNFGERANSYVPHIITFLNDEDADIKKVTRDALLKIGKASKDSVPELINLLKENNEEILSRAIYELGDLGKNASAAVEPLKEIVQKTNSRDVKTMANDALQKIQ